MQLNKKTKQKKWMGYLCMSFMGRSALEIFVYLFVCLFVCFFGMDAVSLWALQDVNVNNDHKQNSNMFSKSPV